MFTTTPSSHPADLFSNYASHFRESKRKKLNDPKTWHNVFYDHVTSKVDEPVFSVLYSASRGRPNASIRILVAMLILKEGFGWSDEKLFEQCEFNILVMRALGLSNFDDEVPVASTYYLFKQSLFSYQLEHGCDLMSETFEKLTQDQAGELGTRGDFIRMDSKDQRGRNPVAIDPLPKRWVCATRRQSRSTARGRGELERHCRPLHRLCAQGQVCRCPTASRSDRTADDGRIAEKRFYWQRSQIEDRRLNIEQVADDFLNVLSSIFILKWSPQWQRDTN